MQADLPPVVHLCTAVSWRGGEQQALYLAQGLANAGVQTLVVAQPESPMAKRSRAAGLRVEEIRCRGEWDLPAGWRLGKLLRTCGAGILHAHDAHGVSIAARAARRARIPAICTRRVDFPIRSPRKYRRMDRVICISRAVQRVCLAAGLPESKSPVVMSGIDLERIRAAAGTDPAPLRREFAGNAKKPLLLLNVASLTDHKGQRYLLEAMPRVLARLEQTRLVIVGTGELENELKRRANLLALDEAVTFAGFREDVPALLHASDLFVVSSHLEGLCTSVMDAMAAGRAVVATRAGGVPELVDDGRTGLLAAVRDPEDLAAKILDLLADRKKRERFAKAARVRAEKHFSKERMVRETIEVYRSLLAGNERRV